MGQTVSPVYAFDPFNIFVKDDKKRLPDGSTESTLELFRYGRPLWGAQIKTDEFLEELMDLAQRKLDSQGSTFLLALLSYRLNFDVVNNALAEDLVSGWLRYILYINEGRDLLRTSQPSEPILAHTSAQLMLNFETRLGVVEQFVRVGFEGSINVGDIGQMITAMILLFTFDEAWNKEVRGLSAAIPLTSFLNALLGEKVASDVVEFASTDKAMRAPCDKGQIFFSHLFKLEKGPDKKTLQQGLRRGVAFSFPDNYPGADILIPVRISAKETSFLAIQVKNRKGDSYSAELREETRTSFQKASKALGFNVPFIGLTMALRCDDRTMAAHNVGNVHPEAASGHDLSPCQVVRRLQMAKREQEHLASGSGA